MKDQIHVGHVVKSFGREGAVRVAIKTQYLNDVKNSGYLLIEQEGYSIPFFIQRFDEDEQLILFEDINGPEEAKKISNSKAFLLQRHIKDGDVVKKDSTEWDIIGYLLLDQTGREIGNVSDVNVMPMQILLEVEQGGRFMLIPFHEDLIIGLDSTECVIQLAIAEGLLDL